MNTIYISGFTGFIGSHLIHSLKEEGFRVRGIDIRNKEAYRNVLPLITTTDFYVHLGEPSSIQCELKANSPEFIALVEAFRDKFVYVSSALVYGTQTEKPHKIQDPCLPNSAYTRLKVKREAIVRDYGGSVIRLSNVYGPGLKKGLISTVFDCLIHGKEFDFARGNSIRDYIFIDDVVQAFRNVLMLMLDKTETSQFIHNVGSGKGTETSQLIQVIESITGLRLLGGGFGGSAITDVNRLEVKRTRSKLNWQSRTSLKQGLEVTWKSLERESYVG